MEPTAVRLARPQRADARRNRERILEAAKTAFAGDGHAQIEEIARQAGVGVGTVYRHFPTKEALVGELVSKRLLVFLRNATEALETISDPWEALEATLRRNAEVVSRDAALQQTLMRDAAAWRYAERPRADLLAVTAKLIDRAKATGAVREDLRAEDVPMLMCGVCSVMAAGGGPGGQMDWRRHFEFTLDSLRPPMTR
jgi:AcrR family transcriptional regulator